MNHQPSKRSFTFHHLATHSLIALMEVVRVGCLGHCLNAFLSVLNISSFAKLFGKSHSFTHQLRTQINWLLCYD